MDLSQLNQQGLRLFQPFADPGNGEQMIYLFLSVGDTFASAAIERSSDPDPVDRESVRITGKFLEENGAADIQCLYPGSDIDLRGLLLEQGVGHPSPFNILVRPDFGTWFAVRTCWRGGPLDTAFPGGLLVEPAPRSPCDDCTDRPCIPACIGNAVETSGFSFDQCMQTRLADGRCAGSCQARNRCPVAPAFRYRPEIDRYHSTVSLDSIRNWINNGP